MRGPNRGQAKGRAIKITFILIWDYAQTVTAELRRYSLEYGRKMIEVEVG